MNASTAGIKAFSQVMTLLLTAGLAAPITYVATVVVGGALWPGYSHIANAISELIEAGRGAELQPWFLVYNLLVIAYAWELNMDLGRRDRRFALGAAMLGTGGVLGVAMVPFPMDPIGSAATASGAVHLAIAGLMSVSSMATLLLFALSWRAQHGTRGLAAYTFSSLAVVFVSGALAAAAVASRWSSVGLWERMTIGTYLLWMFVTAAAALRHRAATVPSTGGCE